MAKVGILTFHFSNNTGAMLQTYGLSKAIIKMGHEVEVIDYRPLSIRQACEPPLPRHPLRLLRTLYYRNVIRGFRRKFLPLTRVYLNPEELRSNPPHSDYIVCGSDQVWNIKSAVRGFDPVYFLAFLKNSSTRRISYAASFGNGTELGEHKQTVANLLSKFDHISVRDITSQKLVLSLIDKYATHVLDPSFLTDYTSITPKPIIKEPYILAYCFRKTKISEQALSLLQSKYQMPVISIKTPFDNAQIRRPSPLEWLSLMKHASYVCTDSFHGTCFSLKNRKQFLTLTFKGGESRLEDILQTMNLSERFIENEIDLKNAIETSINYELVDAVLEIVKTSSFTYLRNALEE